MKRGSLFERFLMLLTCSCLLTAILAACIYAMTGAGVYADRIASEMLPRAQSMARLAARYQTGQMSYDSFLDFSLKEQQGSRVYIFDSDANLIAYTTDGFHAGVSSAILQYGREVVDSNEEMISTKWRSSEGIVVGVPITDNMQRSSGAIVMSRSTKQVYSSMRGMIAALIISSLVASVLMVVPAFFASRYMSSPIKRMTRASCAMASGDFSIRADESLDDEIGQLGAALNHMSTQLRRNLNDLLLARNRLHTILDGMQEGVIAFDSEGKLIYSNAAAQRLFGVADETSLLSAAQGAMSLCLNALKSEQAQIGMLDVGARKLLVTASLSKMDSEAAAGTVAVIQDVTASERLEQTRRDYVANVSHELRTPIASIRSVAETLNDGLIKTDEDRARYYGYILRESMRLSRLINDLLELSRLQSGSVALEKTPFDLCELVDEVASRMEVVASYSNITVRAMHEGLQTLNVLSNRDRIEQVLIALVDNAIKFASDDGAVDIEVSREEQTGHALVSVRNTGHIGENDLPHLFERFYKADTAHTDGGTGLGLAITHEIITSLGEEIIACNEGGDAVFRFTVSSAEPAENV